MFKVIIAGGRDFNDYNSLNKYCSFILKNKKNVVIISGQANGADNFGEKFALEKNHNLVLFPANWDLYGKSAGYIRNEQMAKYSNALIAFWNKKSKGTKHMIDLAKKNKLDIRIYYYD